MKGLKLALFFILISLLGLYIFYCYTGDYQNPTIYVEPTLDDGDIANDYGNPNVRIENIMLPKGLKDYQYFVALMASGGVEPYTWTTTDGEELLAYGLTLSADGYLTGEPSITTDGEIKIEITCTDAVGKNITKTFNLFISEGTVTIKTTYLSPAASGQPYYCKLAAMGGVPYYSWFNPDSSLQEMGLEMISETGEIYGTVSASPGIYNVEIRVRDHGNPHTAALVNLLLEVNNSDSLYIVNPKLPPAVFGNEYKNARLSVVNGTPPYRWLKLQGQLPNGLATSEDGTFYGKPSSGGGYTPIYRVTDSLGNTTEGMFYLTVKMPEEQYVKISTEANLPVADILTPINYKIEAEGGVPPYKYVVTEGLDELEAVGLSFNRQTGEITGQIDASVDDSPLSFVVKVIDNYEDFEDPQLSYMTDSKNFILAYQIKPVYLTTGEPLPIAVDGLPYELQFEAEGGYGDYSFGYTPRTSLFSIANLSLSTDGKLTSPAVDSRYTTYIVFDIIANDSSLNYGGPQISQPITYHLSVSSNPLVFGEGTSTFNWDTKVGNTFSYIIYVDGGVPPYEYIIDPADIDELENTYGLVWDSEKGEINGAPTTVTAGETYSIEVRDSHPRGYQNLLGTIILVVEPNEVHISSGSDLGQVQLGDNANVCVATDAGVVPFEWTIDITSGHTLDEFGLHHSTDTGCINGYVVNSTTNPVPQTITFNTTVTDSSNPQAQDSGSFFFDIVDNPVTITTSATLPIASVGVAYTEYLNANGGDGDYTWELVSGETELNSYGLSWNGETATITGIPNAETTAPHIELEVRVKDGLHPETWQDTKTFTLQIVSNFTFTDPGTMEWDEGIDESFSFSTSNGFAPITYSLDMASDGTGPLTDGCSDTTTCSQELLNCYGITFDGTAGTIGGAPINYTKDPDIPYDQPISLTITATDSNTPIAQTDSKSPTIVINRNKPELASSSRIWRSGREGNIYYMDLQVINGIGPYTITIKETSWEVRNDENDDPAFLETLVPDLESLGLTLDTDTGEITGTITPIPSSYKIDLTFTVEIEDSFPGYPDGQTHHIVEEEDCHFTIFNNLMEIEMSTYYDDTKGETVGLLLPGKVGDSYYYLFNATGGVEPFSWDLAFHEPPDKTFAAFGLEFDGAEGVLSTIATTDPITQEVTYGPLLRADYTTLPQVIEFDLTVTDDLYEDEVANGAPYYPNAVNMYAYLEIGHNAIEYFAPSGNYNIVVGEYLMMVMQASGGVPPYSWSITDPGISESTLNMYGLEFNEELGILYGIPRTTYGSPWRIDIMVEDSCPDTICVDSPQTGGGVFTLTVMP